MCVHIVHMHGKASGASRASSPTTFFPAPLRQGLSLYPELGYRPIAGPSDALASLFPGAMITGALGDA